MRWVRVQAKGEMLKTRAMAEGRRKQREVYITNPGSEVECPQRAAVGEDISQGAGEFLSTSCIETHVEGSQRWGGEAFEDLVGTIEIRAEWTPIFDCL